MTLLCDENLLYWFSELNWSSPSDGLKAQSEKWEYLGRSSWYIDEEHRLRQEYIFTVFNNHPLGGLPEWHNEYCEID